MNIVEDGTLKTPNNNLRDCNIEQLVNYITTEEDDIVKCFNLEGAFGAEIDAEFNQMETVEYDSSFEEEEDAEDTMSTSSGFCSANSCISDDADSKERTSFTYSNVCMNEENQSSGISMYFSNDSHDMSELSLEEVNESIIDNSKSILKHLQRHSIKDAQLKKILQIYKKTLVSGS